MVGRCHQLWNQLLTVHMGLTALETRTESEHQHSREFSSVAKQRVVFCLDPGGTTGYAYGIIGADEIFRYRGAGQSQLSPMHLYGMLESVSPAYLIAEKFESRVGIAGVELVSRDLLGVCSLWATIRDCHYHQQSASEGFAFYADAKLQKLGVYIPGNVHANDATRHLLHWATFKQGSQWLGQGRNPVIDIE